MTDGPIQIKRYPNRRYYARNTRKYVSLIEIEEMVKSGSTVEIRDSQSGSDLTRVVLTQIIVDRHPDKMSLFPVALLHGILRSNDMMSGFLRDYFRHSLTYLDYLQNHAAPGSTLVQPMHWVKAWLDGITSTPAGEADPPDGAASGEDATTASPDDPESLSERVQQLEQRLKQLEPPAEP